MMMDKKIIGLIIVTRECGNYRCVPLKAARRDAIANLRSSWGPGHKWSNFSGFIYIHNAAPPSSTGISAIYLLLFGEVWVPFADPHVRRLAMNQKAEFTEGG